MLVELAGSLIAATCLQCAPTEGDDATARNTDRTLTGDEVGANVLRYDVGPVSGLTAFRGDAPADPTWQEFDPENDRGHGLGPRIGSDFSVPNFARPHDAARFSVMDFTVPDAVRRMDGERLSAEFSIGASGERTGLGLDVELAPRAQIERNRGGADVSRTGAEVRLGQNLSDRDLRGKYVEAPSWYFFVGADNEALVWNMADASNVNGMSLRDQATVGDLQAGVAWSTPIGGQMSFGLIEREMSFNDLSNERDVKTKDHFAAFSYTLRR
ncbi:MAG: hypothetical protein R3C52_03265 [Hyphomonadaceae bacterium]